MIRDPFVWPRESVADKPNQAWCTACRNRFASGAAFDQHRGIKLWRLSPEIQDNQEDRGTCSTRGLQALDYIWYTTADATRRNQALGALAARQRGGTS